MEITSVRVHKVELENSRMKGIASVVIDDAIAIHDIRIIEGKENLFIAMPSRKTPAGEYKDIVHPINQEVRTTFEKTILDAYENAEEDTKEADEE
jgi:stage V sporulation protein G